MGRPETGAMQFGKDWPGVFIRGDDALYHAGIIDSILDSGILEDHNEFPLRILYKYLNSSYAFTAKPVMMKKFEECKVLNEPD